MEFKWIIIYYGTYRTPVFMIKFIHTTMADRYCESAIYILWVDKIKFYYSNFSSSIVLLDIFIHTDSNVSVHIKWNRNNCFIIK